MRVCAHGVAGTASALPLPNAFAPMPMQLRLTQPLRSGQAFGLERVAQLGLLPLLVLLPLVPAL